MTDAADPLDDLFHGCALAAFLDQARAERGWPGREATRRRAYVLYEAALATNSILDTPPEPCYPSPRINSDGGDR